MINVHGVLIVVVVLLGVLVWHNLRGEP